jgi:hypothetical protein
MSQRSGRRRTAVVGEDCGNRCTTQENHVIVRRKENAFVLIRQPDHAVLAVDLISAWTAGGFPTNPRRDRILAATRAHDNGWTEEDDETIVGDDGGPVDFIAVPVEVKQRVWPRAVDRLAGADAYTAALVAQHSLTIFTVHREDSTWTPYFDAMTAARDRLLARCDPSTAGAIAQDYHFLRLADLLSLAFCNDWRQPLNYEGHHITLTDRALIVSPDPFGGSRIDLRVPVRRVPRRRYASAADFRAAVASASIEVLEGEAVGG